MNRILGPRGTHRRVPSAESTSFGRTKAPRRRQMTSFADSKPMERQPRDRESRSVQTRADSTGEASGEQVRCASRHILERTRVAVMTLMVARRVADLGASWPLGRSCPAERKGCTQICSEKGQLRCGPRFVVRGRCSKRPNTRTEMRRRSWRSIVHVCWTGSEGALSSVCSGLRAQPRLRRPPFRRNRDRDLAGSSKHHVNGHKAKRAKVFHRMRGAGAPGHRINEDPVETIAQRSNTSRRTTLHQHTLPFLTRGTTIAKATTRGIGSAGGRAHG